jgi:integrase
MWHLAYRLPGMEKEKRVPLGISDKQAAERRKRELIQELEQEKAGVIAPRPVRESALKPLMEHVEAYASDLRAAGRDRMYAYNVEKRLAKLSMECGWKTVGDVTPDSFQAWRARQGGKSAKTLKDYHDAADAFMKWMVRNNRCGANPLVGVAKIQTKGKETRKRRAATFEELNRLLSVAGSRAVGYLAAFFTGLRRAELESLEWGDIHLDRELPFIAARAGTTKNGLRAEIRLHPQLAEALAAMRPVDVEAGASVFGPGKIPSMWMMKKDLAAAGVPFEDGQGRRVDFHSLRGTLNTHMALAKVDPQLRQKIMRHSDIKLTLDTYTDSTLLRVSEAITVLPSFDQYAVPCAVDLGISGQNTAQAGTNGNSDRSSEGASNQSISRELAQTDTTCHNEANGCLTRIRNQ